MGNQSSVHDNSFMDSQSMLDCSQSQQQPPLSPARNVANCSTTDTIPHTTAPIVTATHVETSSLAKVQESNSLAIH